MTMRPSILAAVLLVLGACDLAEPNGRGENASAPAALAAISGENAPAAPAAEQPETLVNLDGEGVRLVDARTGAATPLSFGTPITRATEILTAAFGSASIEQATNEECGAGPILHIRWSNGFVALAQEGNFLGWDAREPGLATAAGVGIGSTRADLERAYEVTIEQTSLGTEFSAGGLGSVLSSQAPDAPIGSFWAGLTCLFR